MTQKTKWAHNSATAAGKWTGDNITGAKTEADAKALHADYVTDAADADTANKTAIALEASTLKNYNDDVKDTKAKDATYKADGKVTVAKAALLKTATSDHLKECPAAAKGAKAAVVKADDAKDKLAACTDAETKLTAATTAHTDAVKAEATSKTAWDDATKAEAASKKVHADAVSAAPLALAKKTATAAWALKAKTDLTQEWDATTQKWFATWYTERCAATESLDDFKSGIAAATVKAHTDAVAL